jgi:hypothetical protein
MWIQILAQQLQLQLTFVVDESAAADNSCKKLLKTKLKNPLLLGLELISCSSRRRRLELHSAFA